MPDGLIARPMANGEGIRVEWTAVAPLLSASGTTVAWRGYNVYRHGPGGQYGEDPINSAILTGTQFNDTDSLLANTLYDYKLTVVDLAGNEYTVDEASSRKGTPPAVPDVDLYPDYHESDSIKLQ